MDKETKAEVNEYFEKRKGEERHNWLIDKVREIAQSLGDGWAGTLVRDAAHEMMRERAQLINPRYRYVIFVRYAEPEKSNQLMFRVDGSYFINKATYKSGERINVSLFKKSAVIARDIKRRLLPILIEHDREANENMKEAEEYDTAVNNNKTMLIHSSNGLLKQCEAPHLHSILYYRERNGIEVEAKAAANYVDLKIEDLAPEDAIVLVKFIFDHLIEKRKAEIGDAVRKR